MVDVKISAMPNGTVIADTDELEGSDGSTSRAYQMAATRGFKNKLLNGCFRLNQRAPATNADDTYAHDRWYALTQTGTIALSTLTDVENGTIRMARLTQSQAAAQRMGYAQIIEGKNCKQWRGKQVTFRFGRYRCSAAQAIRFAVLEWTGAEDAVTSDVVNDWTSATYTAGNFFLAASLTISGVVAQTPSAATLADGPNVTVTLGSAFNNLIVFAWTEGTAAQNVTLDLGKAQLERGAAASPFEEPAYGYELARCRLYRRHEQGCVGVATSTTAIQLTVPHAGMRVAPSVGLTAALQVTDHIAADFTQSAADIGVAGAQSADSTRISAGNFTGMTSARFHSQIPAGGLITLDAEL